jgi:protocatechuate 4,5-dioxygenase alpha chain
LTWAVPNRFITNMSKKPEDYEDIPGTWVFDAERARKGYHLNAFFYSLMSAANRAEFLADEPKYLDKFPITAAQREAVLKRDWNMLLELGGVSYAIVKLAFTDKKSYQHMASKMAGVTESEYVKMMMSGGRSPDGWRSKSERNG